MRDRTNRYPYRNYAIKMVSQPTQHLKIKSSQYRRCLSFANTHYTTGVEQTSASYTATNTGGLACLDNLSYPLTDATTYYGIASRSFMIYNISTSHFFKPFLISTYFKFSRGCYITYGI